MVWQKKVESFLDIINNTNYYDIRYLSRDYGDICETIEKLYSDNRLQYTNNSKIQLKELSDRFLSDIYRINSELFNE